MESGEQSSATHKATSSLFPAYASSSQNTEAIMESGEQSSTTHKATSSLFPAYASSSQNTEVKKDWLCNSSFTDSAFKEVSQILNAQKVETVDNVSVENIQPEIPSETKKKKPQKRKAPEKYPDPSSFSVPESDSIFHQLKKKTFIEETGLSFERAFQIDNTRDPDNLMFECFERTKIASYHVIQKAPAGLSTKELLSWCKDIPKKKEKRDPRYFSKKSFLKLIKSADIEEVHLSKENLQSSCLNYIPISVSSNTVENAASGPNFMNVSTSWKTDNTTKEKVLDDTVPSEPFDVELREKIIYYNKNLSDNPNNIEMWIAFVDFQDELFLSGKFSNGHMHSKSKSVTEKKIAILEKALKYNPKNVRLNTMNLKLCKDLYSSDKVISMWDELIFFNPNNSEVWQEYLLYILSNLETFNIPRVLKLYGKCLRTLSDISEGIAESHKPSPDIVSDMLGIFNQLCCILKSCDYVEKAIATYQALIELNLFCESSMEKLTINERIACLEPYWDSGAPRFGENKAIGWASTVQQKKVSFDSISTDSDLNIMEDEILNQKLTISETWLEFEKLRAANHWLPWRPNPEYDQTADDIDDVERTVLFDDVAKFLFRIPKEEQKFLLIIHFVVFLGFDVHQLGCYNMTNKVKSNSLNIEEYEIISQQINKIQLIHKSANPICFDIHFWTEEKYNFVNNVFSQVVERFTPKYKTLCTYLWVKFKKYYCLGVLKGCKEDITSLKKFVKSILKRNENRNCLLLWFEYISIEWLTDKAVAMKTFHALFLSSTSAVSEGNMQLSELWYFTQAFIELYLNGLEHPSSDFTPLNEILWILIHVVNKEKYVPYSNQELKPTVILKTVSSLKNALENELNSLSETQNIFCYCIDPYNYAVINCAKCLAYFQYFSQGSDVAVQVYEKVISFVNTTISGHWGKYILEQITVAQAKLLNYHTWNSTCSIKPLQTFLCNSVKNYPHNSQLLYLLVKLRTASSVISPTRRFLSQVLKNHHLSYPVTWIFALIAEFAVCCSLLSQSDAEEESQISETIISNLALNWRIRSLYEKMLQSDMCEHQPILWRSYLKFEIMTLNIEKAQGVFYRAIQNCGWSKELLMDAIKYFPDKLKENLAFMTEKQIRVHTPLEEVTLLMEHAVTDS